MDDNKETDSKKGLSPEDIEMWEAVTQDVEPLAGREVLSTVNEPQKPEGDVAYPSPAVNHHAPFVRPKPQKSKQSRGREIDGSTERRLQRGEIPIEGRLDMHGMNQGEARQALFNFIQSAYQSGKRCVLVVTGKGNSGRSSANWLDRGSGVLRQNTPLWLREGALSDIVLRAVPAQPKDGGGGALYVYLRRRRD